MITTGILTLNATANFGIVKVNVTGSVSSYQSNTRSSDNSAKYHVDIRAANHGIPEGLARVLDMMAANVAPELLSSDLKDGNEPADVSRLFALKAVDNKESSGRYKNGEIIKMFHLF